MTAVHHGRKITSNLTCASIANISISILYFNALAGMLLQIVLPQIGGRIHAIRDKTSGYDLICRQRAIKRPLAGLTGPWFKPQTSPMIR